RDGREKPKAVARVLVARNGHECAAQLTIVGELFRAVNEPEIELVVNDVSLPRRQRRRRVVEIVDEMSGMDAEKPRQQSARRNGEMAVFAALDLREIGLADAAAELLADGAADFDLGHLAVETAGVPFECSQPGELFAECHNNQQYIADCYISQGTAPSLAISMTSESTAAAVGIAPAPLPAKNISPAALARTTTALFSARTAARG